MSRWPHRCSCAGILDGYDVSFLSGEHAMTGATGKVALDSCARAVPGDESLTSAAARGVQLAPDTSLLFLITGPNAEFATLQRAASQFPPEVTKVGVRIEGGSRAALRSAGDLPLLTLGRLEDLPALLNWGM